MADDDRALWQTPSIEALTEVGIRADGATARMRNGLGDNDSVAG